LTAQVSLAAKHGHALHGVSGAAADVLFDETEPTFAAEPCN
jgi:hypothetical protein